MIKTRKIKVKSIENEENPSLKSTELLQTQRFTES